MISNDPTRPKLELTLAATITPLVAIDPAPIALLFVGAKPVSQVFTLQRSGNRPMNLLEVLPDSNAVTAQAKPLPGVGRYQVTVTAPAGWTTGRGQRRITVTTDDPAQPEVTIPVMTVAQGELQG